MARVEPPTDQPTHLIVLFGGRSAEHEVSCVTATHVLAAIDRDRFRVTPVGITTAGVFVRAAEPADPMVPDGPPVTLTELVAEQADTVVLPLLHGPLGEDGTIQGMLEILGVAYVGAGVLGSAVAMDKAMAKTILDAEGVPQAAWLSFTEREIAADASLVTKTIVDTLGLPVFVKPANMGSSVGVTKAADETSLQQSIAHALRYDELVVVEEAVTAREIEMAVLGNDELDVSVPGEIVPAAEFYDYDDKYVAAGAQLLIPADIPPTDVERMQDLAAAAYRALRVEGMARADFLYEQGGRGPLLNELNTIPGFTPISMYPKMWEASGLAYPDLINRLVDLAVERHARRAAKRVTDWS